MGQRSREKAARRKNAQSELSLRQRIALLVNCPGHFGFLAQKTLDSLDGFSKLFKGVKKYNDQLGIDVILQHHPVPGRDIDPNVLGSQHRVAQVLEEGRYDVVGVEGFSADPLTITNCAKAVIAVRTELGLPPTTLDREEKAAEELSQGFAGLRYAMEHPEACVIGCEDEYLNGLHLNVLGLMGDLANGPLRLRELHPLLRQLRDKVALSKVVGKLQFLTAQRGAIITGFNHRQGIKELLGQLNIQHKMVSALS